MYQTNELIDLSVARLDTTALAAGDLTLTVTSDEGSKLTFIFPVQAVSLENGVAARSEQLHLNGRLLRPDKYTLTVDVDGTTATKDIEIYSHLRLSTFIIGDWGCPAKDDEQTMLGPVGFNLVYAHYGGFNQEANIRGGIDYMSGCTISAVHQMDMRVQDCDWSDPSVLIGAEARVVRRALQDRSLPNCLGVHFYDEPGLTWNFTAPGGAKPWNILPEDVAFQDAFGEPAKPYTQFDPTTQTGIDYYLKYSRFRLQFMDAFEKIGTAGVSKVNPKMLSVTQSVYSPYNYTDGYYFNVVRSMPVISGHGGYDDWGVTYMLTTFTNEIGGRLRALNKPYWYMPIWSDMPSERYRMEEYLSFMSGIQGMFKPPNVKAQSPQTAASSDGLVESNLTMQRLGTIFNTMPPARNEVAVLVPLSQALYGDIAKAPEEYRWYGPDGTTNLRPMLMFYASKMTRIPIDFLVEEDVLDGSMAHYKAVVIPGATKIETRTVRALEAYTATGGTIFVTDESTQNIAGAKKLGCSIDQKVLDSYNQIAKGMGNNTERFFALARPIASAYAAKMTGIGIQPVAECSEQTVFFSRQGKGDIEYLFAVNATYDSAGAGANAIKSTAPTIALPNDGRPVYDAVRGGLVSELKADAATNTLRGVVRFGAGAMRVFARTARPIGGVDILTPVVYHDFTVTDDALHVEISATLVDDQHHALNGSAPLEITLIDPLGVQRYHLYRATKDGRLALTLPLAANDPNGAWTLTIRELLANTSAKASFQFSPPAQCGALAGASQRAIYFPEDRENVTQFFRDYHELTIVKGDGDYTAAADRLVKMMERWDYQVKVVQAADVNKPRQITDEQWKSWAGLEQIWNARIDRKRIDCVGFDLRGPAILLGTPDDNPLIKFAIDQHFITYPVDKTNFPGAGRGFISWQRSAVSYGSESVTLIGYDEKGISEAVGSLYEMMAAMDPLMPLEPPVYAMVTPANKATVLLETPIVWTAVLPDRASWLAVNADNTLSVQTFDGGTWSIDVTGKVAAKALTVPNPLPKLVTAVPDIATTVLLRYHNLKAVAIAADGTLAIGYWGGSLQLVDAAGMVKCQQILPQDIVQLAWQEKRLIAALADGRILALRGTTGE